MHRIRLAFAAALVLAAFEAAAAIPAEGLSGLPIQSCLGELRRLSDIEGHSDSHNFDLNKRCPDLAKQLAASLHDEDAGSIEIDATSIQGLQDLESFAAGFHHRPLAAEKISLDFDGLEALLADVLVEESSEDGLWEQFLHWLKQYARDDESVEFRRLLEWLEGLDAPPWLGDVILSTSMVLIIVLALIVIGNEVWLSRLWRRIRLKRRIQAHAGTATQARKARAKSVDDLRDLPARQLAAAMLEVVITALAERGWLSSGSSRTNGELIRQIGQRRNDLADSFTRLVNGIERIIYGDRSPDDETRQGLIDTAAELVERARSAPTATSASAR